MDSVSQHQRAEQQDPVFLSEVSEIMTMHASHSGI